ncbi:MAG: dual specificity protein phosphatase family protein [Anaerolineae bacterium]|nr:dual specificity protein phosphatase family protein [Anaerolineae bacterium]
MENGLSQHHPARPIEEAYWGVPGRLLCGPYPTSTWDPEKRRRLERLLDAGVNVFVDLTCPDDAPPYAQHLGAGVRHYRVPIADFDTPTVQQMQDTLNLLDRVIGTGKLTYLHCVGGLGRTGTVVGCFLVRHGATGPEALEKIRELRQVTPYPESPSPETMAQRRMVLTWRSGQ